MGGGGGGGKQKKNHARENAMKTNSCKGEVKEKKFMQKEGPTPGPAILIPSIYPFNKPEEGWCWPAEIL